MPYISVIIAFLKKVPVSYYKVVGLIFIGAVIGFKMRSCTYHCPVLVSTTTVVKYDTIYSHDTVKITIGANQTSVIPQITFHKQDKLAKLAIKDSSTQNIIKPDVILPETSFCYQAQKKMPDSALIGVKVCSRILPIKVPIDWTWDITYLSPPKIEKTIKTKLQYVTNKIPLYDRWWIWAPVTIAVGCVTYKLHH